jgi:hypothetical protein
MLLQAEASWEIWIRRIIIRWKKYSSFSVPIKRNSSLEVFVLYIPTMGIF